MNGGKPNSLAPYGYLSDAVADASGNVYFTGQLGLAPYFWKNDVSPLDLSIGGEYGGWVEQIVVDSSGNLYASGEVWLSSCKPVYWKTDGGVWGAPIDLPMGASYSGYGYWDVGGMALDPSGNVDLYAYIGISPGNWQSSTTIVFWKGASSAPTKLSLGGNAYFSKLPNMCAADADGNFFITCSLGSSENSTKPYYWENGGNPIPLDISGHAFGETDGIVIAP